MAREITHVVALSGGKDSTALALRLAEIEPREYVYICTPTGDELPEIRAHWDHLQGLLGQPIIRLKLAGGLAGLIEKYSALPNWRQRWCTRQLKIEIAESFYRENMPVRAYVGLRNDEESRGGAIYSGDIQQVYPLRDWGWGIGDVIDYLNCRGITIPNRTDCARCYYQTLGEWWLLWRDYPDIYQSAVDDEIKTGHTFRSPSRDTWPTSLSDLRDEFECGRIPRGVNMQGSLFGFSANKCRVCSL